MGCYGAGLAGGVVCLQVNRPGPQNPAVIPLNACSAAFVRRDPILNVANRDSRTALRCLRTKQFPLIRRLDLPPGSFGHFMLVLAGRRFSLCLHDRR